MKRPVPASEIDPLLSQASKLLGAQIERLSELSDTHGKNTLPAQGAGIYATISVSSAAAAKQARTALNTLLGGNIFDTAVEDRSNKLVLSAKAIQEYEKTNGAGSFQKKLESVKEDIGRIADTARGYSSAPARAEPPRAVAPAIVPARPAVPAPEAVIPAPAPVASRPSPPVTEGMDAAQQLATKLSAIVGAPVMRLTYPTDDGPAHSLVLRIGNEAASRAAAERLNMFAKQAGLSDTPIFQASGDNGGQIVMQVGKDTTAMLEKMEPMGKAIQSQIRGAVRSSELRQITNTLRAQYLKDVPEAERPAREAQLDEMHRKADPNSPGHFYAQALQIHKDPLARAALLGQLKVETIDGPSTPLPQNKPLTISEEALDEDYHRLRIAAAKFAKAHHDPKTGGVDYNGLSTDERTQFLAMQAQLKRHEERREAAAPKSEAACGDIQQKLAAYISSLTMNDKGEIRVPAEEMGRYASLSEKAGSCNVNEFTRQHFGIVEPQPKPVGKAK